MSCRISILTVCFPFVYLISPLSFHAVQPNTGGKAAPMVSSDFIANVMKNKDALDNAIDHTKDFDYQ